jgi:hypothetical protein
VPRDVKPTLEHWQALRDLTEVNILTSKLYFLSMSRNLGTGTDSEDHTETKKLDKDEIAASTSSE